MSKRHTYWNIVDKNRFTINANGDCVAFALGNLQYRASDGKWRFAEHQYDIIRAGVGNRTSLPQRQTQTDWIDLFNYGCTGYNNGQTAYQPWAINTGSNDFYNGNTATTTADFSYPYNLQESTTFRTLTRAEWSYIIFSRSGERYAKAIVKGIEGLIIIPDNAISGLQSVNVTSAQYSPNTLTAQQWADNFESEGFVFLPAGGYRNGTNVGQYSGNPIAGFYSASTQQTGSNANRNDYLQFKTGSTHGGVSMGYSLKSDAKSVRLVIDL